MTTLILSHGDKGGVGKSTVAILMASRLHEYGRSMAILETDARGLDSKAGGTPDVGPRFSGRIDEVVTLPLNDTDDDVDIEQSVANLIQVIESLVGRGIDYIVLNTPASASATIEHEKVGSMLAALLEEIGVDLRVAYSLFPEERSTEDAAEAFNGDLIPSASRKMIVANRFWGKPIAFDRYLGASKTLKNVTRVELPKASSDIGELIRYRNRTNFLELSNDAESLDRATRFRIRRWYTDAADRLLDGIGISLETGEDEHGAQ